MAVKDRLKTLKSRTDDITHMFFFLVANNMNLDYIITNLFAHDLFDVKTIEE